MPRTAHICLLSLWLSPAALARPYQEQSTSISTIKWTNCTANDPPRLQCGTLIVPMDYSKRNGQNITLFLARIRSTKQPAPLGSLLVNYGGPGGAAAAPVISVAQGELMFSDELTANYDIIGLDPRGTGMSNPVKCDNSIWNQRVSRFPTNQDAYNNLLAHNTAFGASCEKLTGSLLNHLDTLHVVEDFERLRLALNEGGLNLLAFSYGTQIAIQYAEKYPEHINRFVLDGIVDHTLPEVTTLDSEIQTYEATLNQFFLWCGANSSCALHGQDVARVFDTIVDTADTSPIPALGCSSSGENACFSNVTGEDVLFGVQFLLAGPNIANTWPLLGMAIAQAARGNATLLSMPLITSDTSDLWSFIAIACQDWLHADISLTKILETNRLARALVPHTRGASEFYLMRASCLGWPAPMTNPQHSLRKEAQTAPPMLLVNSVYDPEASLVWAIGMQDVLPKSVLLTRNGAGHTSYLNSLTGETRKVEDDFLITGKLPDIGTVLNS